MEKRSLRVGLENIKRDGFVLADSDSLFDWARTGSLWPMTLKRLSESANTKQSLLMFSNHTLRLLFSIRI